MSEVTPLFLSMDADDTKNLYEVTELHEYDANKGSFPSKPPEIKLHVQQPSPSKIPPTVVVGVVVLIVLMLIILLVVAVVTLTHLNTLQVCNNSGSTSGELTSGGGGSGSCGACNLSHDMTEKISQILNMTRETSSKVNGIASYATTDAADSRNFSNLVVQLLQENAWKVEDVRSSTNEQMSYIQNITTVLFQMLQKTEDSATKLMSIVNTLSNLKDTSMSTAGVVDDILVIVEELLGLQNVSSLLNSISPVSCKDIKTVLPNSPSGYYYVNGRNIYCNMDTLCSSGEGWTRLAYLDMSDATQSCPSGFKLYQQGGVRACGRQSNSPSCTSITFPTNGLSYTQICGKVIGYQYASTDAIYPHSNGQHNNLNSWYLEGVSITRGSPRQHVWSLMSGPYSVINDNSNCPCNTNSWQAGQIQSFVGSHYYCESGNPSGSGWSHSLYYADPLWDGQNCPSFEAPCCTNPNLPWFHRDYGNASSTDYLELRLCCDEGNSNEDVPIGMYELYIK